MAWDEENNRLTLFGGFGEAAVFWGDTWSWDGAVWRRLPSPPEYGYVGHVEPLVKPPLDDFVGPRFARRPAVHPRCMPARHTR